MNESEYASCKVREALRAMAWERAKGELFSILQTFWPSDPSEVYIPIRQAINDFVTNVEDNGLMD